MSNANTSPVAQLGRERIPVFGSFAPNGSSAIDATSRKGLGWTVAYTSTGLYTITFLDKWAELEACVPSIQLAAADDRYIQAGVYTASTPTAFGTLQLRVVDATGAVADVAADANNRINFVCWFRNTNTGPRRG